MTKTRAQSATRERREGMLTSVSPRAPVCMAGGGAYHLSPRGPEPSPHQQVSIAAVSSSVLLTVPAELPKVHLKEDQNQYNIVK